MTVLRLAPLVLLALPPAGDAQAVDPARPPTRDEYRRCLAEMDVVTEQRAAFHTALKRHEIVSRDIQTLQAVHAHLAARVDRRDGAAVDALNRRIALVNQLSAAASAESARLQKQQFEINDAAISVNQRCGGRVAPAADQEAVLLERLAPRAPK